MTSVEEVHTPAEAFFDAAYRDQRGTLYRALVLAIGNRDVAVEAIDRGFVKWQSRRASRRGDLPLGVMSEAYRWSARRVGKTDRMIQGFRLQSAEDGPASDPILEHLDELDVADRAMLVGLHYLGWNENRAAAAVGVPAGEALPRARAAESRLARSAGLSTDEAVPQLPQLLQRRAESLSEPLGRVDQVKSSARLRRIGTYVGGSVAALALVGGIGFAVTQLGSDTEAGPESPTNGTPSNSDGTIFTAETLNWEQVGLPIRQGDINSVAFGPAGFVAVGNDYSAPGGQSLTLLSSDGIVWDTAPGPTDGPNSWVHQMTVADGRYIAIGSSFNEFNGSDRPLISVSDDGVTWASVELPVESQMEIEGQVTRLHTWVNSVTASGDRVLVMANQNLEFDPEFLLRDAIGDAVFEGGWGWTDRGVEIYSNNGEVQEIIPWDEVGVDESTISLITSGRPLLLSTTDFENWETIELTGFGPNQHVGQMTAIGDSVAALVYGPFGVGLWTSEDGADWTELDAFPANSVTAMTTLNDGVLAIGTDEAGTGAAWLSQDLSNWERVEVPFGGGWFQHVQVSDAGIAVLGEENARPMDPVELTAGDLTIQAMDTGGFIVLDADGVEIARIAPQDIQFQDSTIELYDPDSGELLATLDQREVEDAQEARWREFDVQRRDGPNYVLLLSENGTEWTRIDVADEFGSGFYPNAIAVGPDAVVLSGWQEGGFVEDVFGGGPGVNVWVGTR